MGLRWFWLGWLFGLGGVSWLGWEGCGTKKVL